MIKRVLKGLVRSPKASYRLRQFLSPAVHSNSFWACFPILADALHQFHAPKKPTILLISIPRGGSSWIGDILGSSKESLYLKEPLKKTYMPLIGTGPSFFEFQVCKEKKVYEQSALDAFRGIPRFHKSIVSYPSQWSYFKRNKKRIIIKEVNPLALNWIIESYHPRIIYLLRHPVPVANSFFVQGWTGEQFRNRFSESSLSYLKKRFSIPYNGDFWEQSGALQAIIQVLTMEILQSVKDYIAIHYEDVCGSPFETFKQIFDFCEIKFNADILQKIEHTTNSKASYNPGKYDIARNSNKMPGIWKSEQKKEEVDLVRKGYFMNQPIFYKEDDDW
jgi:hypothetical protein